jgi:hypothetical protein
MMQRYDPLREPAAEEWLEMDELERIALVESYHRNAGIRVPNLPVHATLNVIVEIRPRSATRPRCERRSRG